jgi:hypothetical protein
MKIKTHRYSKLVFKKNPEKRKKCSKTLKKKAKNKQTQKIINLI